MDEPFIAIDAKSSEKLCEWIQKKKQNQIFLLTSHTTSYILPLVDRLIVLDGQELVMDTEQKEEIKDYFFGMDS